MIPTLGRLRLELEGETLKIKGAGHADTLFSRTKAAVSLELEATQGYTVSQELGLGAGSAGKSIFFRKQKDSSSNPQCPHEKLRMAVHALVRAERITGARWSSAPHMTGVHEPAHTPYTS